MKKQLLMVIASAALSTACTGVREDGSSSSGTSGTHGSTGTTGTHGSTGSTGTSAGTSGSTGSGACVTIAQARTSPSSTVLCLDDVTTVLSGPAGAATTSGTKFAGNYFVADATGAAVLVYKSKVAAPTGDPARGDNIKVNGLASQYQGQEQIIGTAAAPINITIKSSGNALPTPFAAASASDLSDTSASSDANLGKYVKVPAGTYTADYRPAEFVFNSADGGAAKYDGFKLTSGSDTILVETYSFRFNTGSCFDGGVPTFSPENGGFKGIFDKEQIQDGQQHKIVILGSCDDTH
jgi:hypothetical protein